MRVYRLEDSRGRGPLACGVDSIRANVRIHKDPYEMMGTASENCQHLNHRNLIGICTWVFSWESAVLMSDFVRYPRSVDEAGFMVNVYEVERFVKYPDGQVMFDRVHATKVNSLSYCELIESLYKGLTV